MLSRTHISVLIALSALIWGAILFLIGVPLSRDMLKPFSLVVAGVSATLYALDRWIWKASFLFDWFVRRPDISGTWEVELKLVSAHQGQAVPSKALLAFGVVRQTYSSLTLRLITEESSSTLVSDRFERLPDGAYQLAAVYSNIPRLSIQERSRSHYGALLLRMSGARPSSMQGQYWTDRSSSGELRFLTRVNQYADDFAEAQTYSYGSKT